VSVVRSASTTLVAQLVSQSLRFGGSIVLARMLDQSQFGLNAMIVAVTTGLYLLSDVGIGASILRSKRDDDAFLHTAFTLNVMRGVLLFFVGTLLSLLLAPAYDEPSLRWWVPLACVQVLLSGMESTKLWTALRSGNPLPMAIIDVVSQVLGLVAATVVAWHTGSVLALITAALVSALVRLVSSHLLPGPTPRLLIDSDARREIFSFGKWVLLSTAFGFVAQRFDVFAIGKLNGFALLGVYGLASQVVMVPWSMTLQLGANLLTPALAAAERSSREELRAELVRTRAWLLPVGALLFVGAATTAPLFFSLAYKPAFHDAGRMVQVLLLPAWWVVLQELATRPLVAISDSRGLAIINGVRVGVTVVTTLVGSSLAGFWGFLGGGVVGNGLGFLFAQWFMHRRALATLRTDLWSAGVMAVVMIMLWWGGPMLAVRLVRMLPVQWPAEGLATLVMGGPLCLLLVGWVWTAAQARRTAQ
jgi:O-antigen/teichoic acid export membrane protein